MDAETELEDGSQRLRETRDAVTMALAQQRQRAEGMRMAKNSWTAAGYLLAQLAQAGYHATVSRMPDYGHWCCCVQFEGSWVTDAYGDDLADAVNKCGPLMDAAIPGWANREHRTGKARSNHGRE